MIRKVLLWLCVLSLGTPALAQQMPAIPPGPDMVARKATGPALVNAPGLNRFRTCLDGALYATCWIYVMGDSIPQGVGTEAASSITSNVVADQKSWPGQARTMYARRYGTNEAGCITPQFDGTDSRVTIAGGSNLTTTGPMKTGVSVTSTSNAGGAGTETFTVPTSTVIDILYYQDGTVGGPGTGSWTYNIDAAGAVTGSSGGSSTGYKKLTISGLSQATHSIVITGTNTNTTYIFAVRYSSGNGVGVCRFAKAGYTVLDSFGLGLTANNNTAVGNSGAATRLAAIYGAWAPDLTVITFLHNDWANQLTSNTSGISTTAANFQTYTQTAANTAVAAGAAVLLYAPEGPPSQTVSGEVDAITVYRRAMATIALTTTHVSYLDMNLRMGTPAQADAVGYFFGSPGATTVHPAVKGHGNMGAAFVATTLRPDITP